MAEQGQPSSAGAELVAAAIRGDAGALRAVWQAERRWVAAILLAYKPRNVELDDLLQDVAVSIVKNIGTLRDSRSLRPWLRATAINAARAAGRNESTRRRHMGQVSELASRAAGACSAGIVEDEAAHILAAASRLPEGYREPLLLRAVRGLGIDQIAQVLELPATTIETRVSRARAMLRDGMADAPGKSQVVRRASAPGGGTISECETADLGAES